MKKNWFQKKISEHASLKGYQKPEKYSGSLKLDSNENFVIGKQYQQDLIQNAKKVTDIREYPLPGELRDIALHISARDAPPIAGRDARVCPAADLTAIGAQPPSILKMLQDPTCCGA